MNTQEPLIKIGARKGSVSDIHLHDGVHGAADGDNWVFRKGNAAFNHAGEPATYRRALRGAWFVDDSQELYASSPTAPNPFTWLTPELITRYNSAHGTQYVHSEILQNLRARTIVVHDLFDMSYEEFARLESKLGHHVGAYCFSRADERLLSTYKLPNVDLYNTTKKRPVVTLMDP